MTPTDIDFWHDDLACTCAVCGGHRTACSHPPVCSEECRREWDVEVGFNRMAAKESNRHAADRVRAGRGSLQLVVS